MKTELNMTLQELWKSQGKSVTGWGIKDGWYIFIHTHSTKHPDSGFANKWHFVVTTDHLYAGIHDFIEEERVPKCFSSQKKAQDFWSIYGQSILIKIHKYESEPWAAEFDKVEVNICRASARFGITTEAEDLRTKETLVTVNQMLLEENKKLRKALNDAISFKKYSDGCNRIRRNCQSCKMNRCEAKSWSKLINDGKGKK